MQEREYLDVLIRSLRKKLVLLNRISVLNQEQRELLQDENMEPDAFDINVQDKDDVVSQIVTLDTGFDEVYAHMKDLMERDHQLYEDQLKEMRELIRLLMAKDATVRAEEQRNYELAQRKFSSVKSKVREMKANQKMVNSYYQTMMNQKPGNSMFLDNKK